MEARVLEVEAGKTLLVVGPASVSLLEGSAAVIGAPVDRRNPLVVKKGRQLPIEVFEHSIFEIHAGSEATFSELEKGTIPDSWREVADLLSKMGRGVATIIGEVDMGKSTLTTYLTNFLIGNTDGDVAVIDADIGQADIGPPSTIGLGVVNNYITDLSSVSPRRLFFVGEISPNRLREKVIRGIKALLGECGKETPFTIINTDGWVSDQEAIEYKAQMLSAIKPDLVIGIALGNELNPILNSFVGEKFIVRPSDAVKPRSRALRKEIREGGYRRFLKGAKLCSFLADYVKLSSALTGSEVDFNQYVRDGRVDELKNLLVGLIDSQGFLAQIGVLFEIDAAKRLLKIYSRQSPKISVIELGLIRLGVDGSELGHVGSTNNQ